MDLGPQWAEWGLWGLFLACFVAATVLPLGSELVLAACLAGPWRPETLWLVASLGNWLGGMSSYGLGRLADGSRLARFFRADPSKAKAWQERAVRHGPLLALLCWAPVIGDPIALALGVVRARPVPTACWMLVGKAVRYAVVILALRGLV
ncbi:MAG: DedA family protein [Flavobacteriales bacterium]|nr:DedA family protein [Flavobacteriales bacterium]